MNAWLRTFVVVVPLLLLTSQADAQLWKRNAAVVAVGPQVAPRSFVQSTVNTSLKPINLPSVAGYGVIPRPSVDGAYIPPYSYRVLPSPYASRHYSGYGTSDFPFYGQPYGRPFDAWSWPYLSHGYYNEMAHYYYPPL